MERLKNKLSYTLYFVLVAFLFCGCEQTPKQMSENFEIMEIDNCEYVVKYYDMNYFFAHKGNCKYYC